MPDCPSDDVCPKPSTPPILLEPPSPRCCCAIDSTSSAPAPSPLLPHLEHKSEVAHRRFKVVSSPGALPLLRVSVAATVVLSSVNQLRSPLLPSVRSQPEHPCLQPRRQSSETTVDTLPSRATSSSTPRRWGHLADVRAPLEYVSSCRSPSAIAPPPLSLPVPPVQASVLVKRAASVVGCLLAPARLSVGRSPSVGRPASPSGFETQQCCASGPPLEISLWA
jgi:hypothetical protein